MPVTDRTFFIPASVRTRDIPRTALRASVAVACVALGFAPGLAAAQDAILLEEIVVSASRTEVPRDRTGATVAVLPRAAIAQSAEPSLADAADTLPGVSVSQSGGPGSATTLRVRGFQARYAPAFLNGIKLSDPSATQQDLNYGALPTLALGRVEVLKGAASAVYGSEAVAGVVNLTTDVPEEDGTRLRFAAEAGSFDTQRASAGFASRSARGFVTLDAERTRSDGISAADAAQGNTERDGFAATTLIATGERRLSDSVTLGFSAFLIDSTAAQDGFDFLTGLPVDADGREDARRTGLRLTAEVVQGAWTHGVALSAARTERYYPTGFTQAFDGQRRDLTWQADGPLAGGALTLGVDLAQESFRADATEGSYDIAAVLAEARLPLGDRADLSLSLRGDSHSEFGGRVSGRAALAVRPDDATVLRASAATGYRAPSLYELFVPLFGNPGLAPETSRSVDLGVERQAGPVTLGATAFWIEVDDLIGFGSTYEQVPGTTTSRGVELSADLALTPDLVAFGNYTFTDTSDAGGDPLFRVPRHDLTLGLRGEIGRGLSGALTLRHVAGLTDTDGGFPAAAVDLPDYTVADLALAREIAPGVELYGRIENLTDADYQTVRGYGTPGRGAYVGLRASF